MGYTHYWTPKIVDQKTWDKFLEDAKTLKKNLPRYSQSAGGYFAEGRWKRVIKIRGGLGTGRPEINKKAIYLNGDEQRGLDHETFYISPTCDDWAFCKTARKPYDLLVCALLIAAHAELGYEVSSDGDLEDWEPAIDYYFEQIYGEGIQNFDYEQLEAILPRFLWKEYVPESYKEHYH